MNGKVILGLLAVGTIVYFVTRTGSGPVHRNGEPGRDGPPVYYAPQEWFPYDHRQSMGHTPAIDQLSKSDWKWYHPDQDIYTGYPAYRQDNEAIINPLGTMSRRNAI